MGIKVDIKRKLGEFSLDIHFRQNRNESGFWEHLVVEKA